MKAYLSGAMEYASGEGADWRKELTRWLETTLGHSVFNPVLESRRLLSPEEFASFRSWKTTRQDRFKSLVQRFIDHDLKAIIEEVDYLICLWDEDVFRGGGSHGEITLAYHQGIPVYLVNRVPIADLSGWILGCSSEVFDDFEALKGHLLELYPR